MSAGQHAHVAPAPRTGPAARVERLRVAVDATPLLGHRTGVGAFCSGLLGALGGSPELDVRAYAVTWRGRELLAPMLPPGVTRLGGIMPARPLHALWRHGPWPPIEWWAGDVDVVHGTNYVVPPARHAARVVSVHDLTMVRFPELCEPATLRFPALMRRSIAAGAWVQVPSHFVAGEVVEHLGADPARVAVVPYGVPPVARERLSGPAVPGGQSRRGLPAPPLPDGVTRYVLALGTIEPRKNLPELVAAFDSVAADVPGVALVVAGADGWGADALAGALANARHRERILRLGPVDDATRASLLEGAALFAYPSLYEGFGFPPLEAMRMGVPVVATSAGSLPEVLGDAAALVPVGDTAALAATLARLLDAGGGEGERLALAERGVRRCALFTWERTAQAMVDLYRRAHGEDLGGTGDGDGGGTGAHADD